MLNSSGDIRAAQKEARRLVWRFFRGRIRPYELDDMLQEAFLSFYGMPVSERPTDHDGMVDFLVRKAKPSQKLARERAKEQFSLNQGQRRHDGTDDLTGLALYSYLSFNSSAAPAQERQVEAKQALAAMRKLPQKHQRVAEILADGGSAIDCHNELDMPLIEAMRLHRSIGELVGRILEDERQERRDAHANQP